MRIFVEEANGHKSAGLGTGHIFTDCTYTPMPTIQATRPVRVYFEEGGGREHDE